MANAFKEKLRRDEVVVVLNPDHPSPSLTEFVAGLGFDAVFIDCEHGVAGVQSIVRPEINEPFLITRYLDAGAGGVMVPHVETAEAARRIVETVRYARPHDHQDKVVVAMIESMTAIGNLPDLLVVDGIDVFFIGPNDLSHSMGYPAQMHHPEVRAMVKRTSGAIRAGGKISGTLVIADTVAEFVSAGCRFLYEHANNFTASGASDFRRRLSKAQEGHRP